MLRAGIQYRLVNYLNSHYFQFIALSIVYFLCDRLVCTGVVTIIKLVKLSARMVHGQISVFIEYLGKLGLRNMVHYKNLNVIT